MKKKQGKTVFITDLERDAICWADDQINDLIEGWADDEYIEEAYVIISHLRNIIKKYRKMK